MNFRTTLQQYQALKNSFVAKYSNKEAWGKKRLGAIDDLNEFVVKTNELIRLDEETEVRISTEIVRL